MRFWPHRRPKRIYVDRYVRVGAPPDFSQWREQAEATQRLLLESLPGAVTDPEAIAREQYLHRVYSEYWQLLRLPTLLRSLRDPPGEAAFLIAFIEARIAALKAELDA